MGLCRLEIHSECWVSLLEVDVACRVSGVGCRVTSVWCLVVHAECLESLLVLHVHRVACAFVVYIAWSVNVCSVPLAMQYGYATRLTPSPQRATGTHVPDAHVALIAPSPHAVPSLNHIALVRQLEIDSASSESSQPPPSRGHVTKSSVSRLMTPLATYTCLSLYQIGCLPDTHSPL